MAEVNKTIYPTVSTSSGGDIQYTNVLTEYPINTELENSIIYATSQSSYGGINKNLLQVWGTYKPNQSSGTVTVIGTYRDGWDIQSNRSVMLVENGYNGAVSPFVSSTNLYNTRYGFDVETAPEHSESQKLVSGFKYYSVVGCIVVMWHYKTGDTYTISHSALSTYLASDYSNKEIVGAYLRVHSGTNATRYGTTIQFAPYQPIRTPSAVTGNPRQFVDVSQTSTPQWVVNPDMDEINNNVTVDSTSVINYFPTWRTTTQGGQNGYPMYGLGGAMFTTLGGYETDVTQTFIRPDSLGWLWFAPEFANWDNFTNYSGTTRFMYLPESKITPEDLYRMASTFGILFTDSYDKARTLNLSPKADGSPSDNLLDNDLYFPVMSEDGYWNGEYTHGADNQNTDQYINDWNKDVNAPFTNGSNLPKEKEDSNDYGDIHTDNTVTGMPNFNNVYMVNASTLEQLSAYLNNSDDSIFDQILKCLEYAGSNPINSVQAVMHLPVGIKTTALPGYNDDIIIGRLNTHIKGRKLSQMVYNVSFGSTIDTIKRIHHNYLDSAPYTSMVAWIPYCGWIDLEPSVVYDKQLIFDGYVDVLSGSITVDITLNGRDGLTFYKSICGSCATPVPLQAFDTASYIGGVINSAGSMGSSLIATAGGVTAMATGNVGMGAMTTLSGISGGINSLYNFATAPQNFVNVGGSPSGSANNKLPRRVGIYVYTVDAISDNSTYDKIGRACSMSTTLNSLHGFTQVGNADLSGITATDREKSELKQLLESGVYLN